MSSQIWASRQRTDAFTLSQALLAAGASVNSDVVLSQGHGTVLVIARSNLAGTVRIFHRITAGGAEIQTDIEASGADPISGEQVVYMVANVIGPFMRVRFTNDGVATQTDFQISAYLLPSGGGGAGGGGGGGGGAADVRNADADADFAAALFGMLTNSRLAYLDNGSADWARWRGDILSNYSAAGRAAASVSGAWVNAVTNGIDTTGANVSRPVEARSGNVSPGFATTLIGLLTKSETHAFDVANGLWEGVSSDIPSNYAAAGRSSSIFRAMWANSITTGIDNTGAAVLRPVEARSSTGFDSSALTLIRLGTSAAMQALNTAGTAQLNLIAPAAPNAAADETAARYLGVRAFVTGRDTSAVAGSQGVTVEARDFVTGADVSTALIGLLTNSRLAYFDLAQNDWLRLLGDLASSYQTGIAVSSFRGPFSLSLIGGTDSTGAAIARSVEARNFDSAGDVAAALIGLTTNSRMVLYDAVSATDWRAWGGYPVETSLSSVAAGVLEARESGYVAMRGGRRFFITHQTVGTEITAQATFVATTPTILIYDSAGNTSTLVLRTIRLTVASVTANAVKVAVMIDPDDRFSAGGTAVVPQNSNEGSATAYPGTAVRFNPTATAADADERVLWNDRIPAGIDQGITLQWRDGVQISGVGSILVYVYDDAGLVAPSIEFDIELEAF